MSGLRCSSYFGVEAGDRPRASYVQSFATPSSFSLNNHCRNNYRVKPLRRRSLLKIQGHFRNIA